jgi:hypothetical protein
VYGESRKKKRRLCGEDYGKIGYIELEGVGKDRGASMDGRGAKGGILVGSTTWFGEEKVSKYKDDSQADRVCRQSMGRVEGSRSVKEWDSEVCVWDEGSKEEGAQEVEIVHQQTGEQKSAQMKGKL